MSIPSLRDKKAALGSIKEIADTYDIKGQAVLLPETPMQQQGQLQNLLSKIRTQKLRDVFLFKLQRGNIFQTPIKFHILSQKQKDQMRLIKWKGINLNQHILSLIYILDIIFVLATFIIGSYIAFLDDFRQSGDRVSTPITVINIITIIVTSIKILASSISITIEDGILLVYLTDILKNYILTFVVFIDLAHLINIVISFSLQNDSSAVGVSLFVVSLIKLFSLYGNLRIIQTTFIDSFRKQQYWNLVQVWLFNIFFAHFLASILLAMSKIDDEDNWKIYKEIDTEPWYVQYIWSYYWACTIMMTVGFGDFLAFTHREAIIISFLELFSCIVLAYNISSIGNIISALRASQAEYNRKIAIFKRMAQKDDIDHQLQRRIQAYLRQQTQIKERFEFKQHDQLLDQLPEHIKTEYIIQSNKKIFPDLPFFRNLQKTTLVKLSESFKGQVYYPGEYITRSNQADNSIMILKEGKVGLAYKRYGSNLNGTIVQEVQVKQRWVYVPESNHPVKKQVPFVLNTDFLNRMNSTEYDIIAQSYSLIFHIPYEDFFSIINNSQIDSSYYFNIKHTHSILTNEWQQLECQFCSQSSPVLKKHSHSDQFQKLEVKKKYHTKFDCPKLHYFPTTGIIILKTIKSTGSPQFREQDFVRSKKQRAKNCLSLRKNFFKPYEKARNLSFVKKSQPTYLDFMEHSQMEDQQDNKNPFVLCGPNKALKKLKAQKKNKLLQQRQKKQKFQEKTEQSMEIRKIVKQAIQQVITGYVPQFWDLQIDEMHDYSNYFPMDNVRNLDFIPLKQGKVVKTIAQFFRKMSKKKTQQLSPNNFPYSSQRQFIEIDEKNL